MRHVLPCIVVTLLASSVLANIKAREEPKPPVRLKPSFNESLDRNIIGLQEGKANEIRAIVALEKEYTITMRELGKALTKADTPKQQAVVILELEVAEAMHRGKYEVHSDRYASYWLRLHDLEVFLHTRFEVADDNDP